MGEIHQRWMSGEGWAAPALLSAARHLRAACVTTPGRRTMSAFVKAIGYATSFFPHPASNATLFSSELLARSAQFVDEGTLTAEEAIDQGIEQMQVALDDMGE